MKRTGKIVLISIISVVLITAGIGSYFLYREFSRSPNPLDDIHYSNTSQTVPNGTIYNTTEGLVIMELNGSYAEMGYAHGQLVGQFIKYSIEYVVRGVLSGNIDEYNDVYDSINIYVNKSAEMHRKELENIYQAALDSDYDMFVPYLNRNWTLNDLWVLNTVQDWNQNFCSGFGIWDTATSATLSGRTIIGRDLDFYIDPQAYITQLYTIVIYHGNSSLNTVVCFTWPGLITGLTAFNDNGVWLSTDNANGVKTELANRTPMGICMRNFLEQEDGINVTSDAIDYFLSTNPYAPFLFLVGSNESVSDPVVVLEGNDNEVIARTGSDEDNDYVYMTNHQRILMTPQTDCYRYNKYTSNFNKYTTTSDNSISIDEAITMLKESGAGTGTINCVIFFPDTLEFRIGYTRVTNNLDTSSLRGGASDPLLQVTFKLI